MRVLTYATDADGYFPVLQASANRFGFDLEVLGWGEPWQGMATKMIRYRDRLARESPDEVVMAVDAYDVFFCGPALETEIAFKEMGAPFVLSGQRYFPDNPRLRRLADQVMGLDVDGSFSRSLEGQRYGRPCMGALMGRAGALVELCSELAELEARHHAGDDQILVNLHLQAHPEETHIDHECRIFQNLWRTRQPFPMNGSFHPEDESAEVRVLSSGRLENRFTGTHPQVVHGPMHLDLAALITAMGHDLGAIHPVSRSRYFRYSIGRYLKILLAQKWRGPKPLAAESGKPEPATPDSARPESGRP